MLPSIYTNTNKLNIILKIEFLSMVNKLMDNPKNKLVTVKDIESILNHFGNIGKDDKPLKINSLAPYQTAFVQKSFLLQPYENSNGNGICMSYMPV